MFSKREEFDIILDPGACHFTSCPMRSCGCTRERSPLLKPWKWWSPPRQFPSPQNRSMGARSCWAQPRRSRTLIPHKRKLTNDKMTWPLMWSALTQYTPTGEVVPKLAESWEFTDDGMAIIFNLHQGVKFHNGREMVAEDVKFSLDRIIDPDTASPEGRKVQDIESVDVIDDYTVQVNLKQPSASLLAGLTEAMIMPPENVDNLETDPIGTGPFTFVEFVPNDHITVEAFPDYWEEGLPYLDQVTIQIQRDTTAGFVSLTTQRFDFYWQVAPQYHDLVEQTDGIGLVNSGLPLTNYMLVFQTQTPPFDDKRVRQAMLYATDREAFNEAALFGRGIVPDANTIFPPSHWAFNPNLEPWTYDLDKAKALFEEAGITEGSTLIWKCTAITPEYKTMGEILERSLAEIGITLQIELMDLSPWLDVVLPRGKQLPDDNFVCNIAVRDPDPALRLIDYMADRGLSNYINPDFEEIFNQGNSTYDQDERKEYAWQAQEILNEDVAEIVLSHYAWTHGVWEHVQGLELDPSGFPKIRKSLAG